MPRRIARPRLIASAILLTAVAGATAAYAQCEPSPPVRQVLGRYERQWRPAHFKADRDAAIAILLAGLGEHPDDPFLLRARLRAFDRDGDPEARLRWARALHEQHPDQPIHVVLHAEALLGKDTPTVLHMLEALAEAHPELPQTYLALVDVTSTGKFQDQPKMQRALAAFLERCPAPLDGSSLQLIGRHGTPELRARTAAAVRQRLEVESGPALAEVWEPLWNLEFKSRPPGEHAAERQRIAEDLARLERTPQANELEWLDVRRGGYGELGDRAAAARIEAVILRDHPASDTAEEIVRDRWEKEHPPESRRGAKQLQTYLREQLAAAETWRRQWPGDPSLLDTWFNALAAQPDAPVERIASAADEVLVAAKKEPDWYSWYNVPPVELTVAGELVLHKLRLGEVPALIEGSYRPVLARLERELGDDRYDRQSRPMQRQLLEMLQVERARVLLDYLAAVKQPEKAAEVATDLAALEPTRPFQRQQVLEQRARAAEMLGHKLDALMLYRAAVEANAAMLPPALAGSDPLAQDVDRLWQELGGTDAARALLTLAKPPAPTGIDASRWERPARPLPPFTLADLGGRTWKLLDLQGSAVLINVWATWCVPCRLEHPEFQKLYEKLKARTDVAVLSFNVDDDVGKIAPYMNEHHYTFPAIPAREVVDAVVPALSIPRNWFVDRKGQLQWEQLGFGKAADWQQAMTAKLDEMLKQQ